MSVLLAINVYLGGFSHMTVTTRIVFAMSRDGALPLISSTAFSAITQISTIGYSISYAIPIILRVTVSRHTFQQGRYNLGQWSIVNGSVAGIFLIATSLCFFFPTNFDDNMQQTAANFNYTIAVFSGALLIATVYWFLPKRLGGARHFFTGPVRPEELDGKFKERKFVIISKQPDALSYATGASPEKVFENYQESMKDIEDEDVNQSKDRNINGSPSHIEMKHFKDTVFQN